MRTTSLRRLGSALNQTQRGARASPSTLLDRVPQHVSRAWPATATDPSVGCSRRSFVSLNDLAKLTPFGASSSGQDEAGKTQGHSSGQGYSESVTLPYPKAHLFGIISDVKSYEQFVPYCVGSTVLPDTMQEGAQPGHKTFLAELTVGFGNLRERYTSRVTLVDQDQVIAQAIPTPLFEHLETRWTLSSEGGEAAHKGTRVVFTVDYAFANPFYAAVAKAAMHKMASQMIGAFEQRARQLS